MRQCNLVLIIIITFGLFPVVLAKKHCDPLLEKLHHVQSLQRHGYSAKGGISLRKREDRARDRWWQCEKGRGKAKKSSNQAKHHIEQLKYNNTNAAAPFKTNSAIIIKSKYQGSKQRAWLTYYRQPDICTQPKNLSDFAFCSEDKQKQRINFEQYYSSP